MTFDNRKEIQGRVQLGGRGTRITESAQRRIGNSPAVHCWVSDENMIQSPWNGRERLQNRER